MVLDGYCYIVDNENSYILSIEQSNLLIIRHVLKESFY